MSKSIESVFHEAAALIEADKYEEAIPNLETVIKVQPLLASAYMSRGRCHWEMHRWDLARKDFEQALALAPNSADAKWTLGLMYLQAGEFKRGWELYEARWDSKTFGSARLKTTLPSWEPDKGYESVLVWCEQGVGDQILYGAFIKNIYAKKVTAMVDARLVDLFQRANKNVTFIPHDTKLKTSEFDSQIPLGSLGRYFIDFFNTIPFLEPNPLRTYAMCAEMGIQDQDFVIGLSWASTAPKIGAHKSIDLNELGFLWDIPGAKIMTLQYGAPNNLRVGGEAVRYERETGRRFLHPPTNLFFDLDGVAAAMATCNIIVSVSNANVHIAGAMGKPTVVLDANKLWYWNHKDGDRSRFYPSVRLLTRDYTNAPWDKQIDKLKKILEEYRER